MAVAQYLFAFLASAIISRALGPEGRGLYYLPVLAATTCVMIGKLGVDQANVFLYGTSKVTLSHLSAQNGLVALVTGGSLVAAVAALPTVLPSVFRGTPLLLLIIAGAAIPFSIHAQLSGAMLAMTGHVRRQYAAGVIAAALQAGFAIALVAAGRLTVRTALLLTTGASAVAWAVIALPLRRIPAGWLAWNGRLLMQTLRAGLILHLGMLLFFLHLRVDMYLVKAWLGTSALGQYSIAVTLAETLMLATDALAIAVLPTQMENSIRESAARALRAARVNGVLALVLACTAALVSGPAIRLVFGRAYQPAVLPMITLLPGVVALGMQRVCGPPALRAGRPEFIAGIYAATLAANVVLNIFWIPRFGLVGASLASSLSYMAGSVLFLLWTSHLAEIPLWLALRFDAADRAIASDATRVVRAIARGILDRSRDIF